MMNSREAAFQALAAFKRSGAWSDIFLRNLAEKEQMEPRDAALTFRIVYGVLQNLLLCDFYISKFSSVKVKKMEDAVLNILRISVYQIAFMDKVPVNAAVNEGVNLAKKHCARASGFVNAVLRKIAGSKAALPAVPAGDKVKYLSVKFSHPEWLVKYFIDRIGFKEASELLEANNRITPVFAHVNTLLANEETLKRELEADSCAYSAHPWLPGCFELELNGRADALLAFRSGHMQIQDAAARLAALAASPMPGAEVMDVCAAPGGKAFAAAMLMSNEGAITACDIYPQKVHEIEKGAARLGIAIISARQADASEFIEAFEGKFDTVIADVPCSGMGIIRKKPEIRYKTEEEIAGLPEIQKKILSNVSRYVKPGGTLVYSTCTLMKRENEDVAADFLAKHESFAPAPFELPAPIGVVQSGMVTLWPQIHGTDGFFICKFYRSY